MINVRKLIRRITLGHLYALILFGCLMLASNVAMADPLDDVSTKLAGFLTKAGTVATGLIIPTGGLAVTVLALKRKAAKAMGDDDAMARTGNQIADALKLTAIGTGASLLVAVAGSILK
jgi:hypothetical protein